MEQKTKVAAEEGTQNVRITREFDLPLELLFKAYEDPDLLSQWMGTHVLKLENKMHGGYRFETRDKNGNVVFQANGTIHEFVPGKKIIRTFQMDNAPFDVQLEFLEFEAINKHKSKLNMQIVFRSASAREQLMKLPFAYGINMAHNKLEEILTPSK